MSSRLVSLLGAMITVWSATEGYAAERAEFLFVNGGYSSTTNRSDFEEDLIGFRNGLFKGGRSTFLNGGGPKDQNAQVRFDRDGNYRRDALDRIEIFPSMLDYPAATKENVQAAFKDIESRKPERVTVVLTDHGDVGVGAVLWGGEDHVGYPELESFRKTLSPQTWFKSIHSHCWGGAALVDPIRKPPENFDELKSFAEKNYPARRCGLGEARDDEASMSPYRESWRERFWTETFQKNPRASLRDLKQRLQSAGNNPATPVLTSDFFIDDLRSFYCRHFDSDKSVSSQDRVSALTDCAPNTVVQLRPELKDLHQSLRKTYCKATRAEEEIAHLTRIMRHIESLSNDELSVAESTWADRYLEEKSPELMQRYRSAQASIDGIKASYATSQGGTAAPSAQDLSRLADLTKIALEYDKTKMNLTEKAAPDFKKYLRIHATRQWVMNHKQDYPLLSRELAGKQNFSLSEFMKETDRKYNLSQAQRAKLLANQAEQNRALVESLLQDPQFNPLREIYENIRECENTPLN